jgi:hypothetical protein
LIFVELLAMLLLLRSSTKKDRKSIESSIITSSAKKIKGHLQDKTSLFSYSRCLTTKDFILESVRSISSTTTASKHNALFKISFRCP